MTPYEISLHLHGFMKQRRFERDLGVMSGWFVATLSRAKRIPPLRSVLSSRKARRLTGKEAERLRKQHKELVERMAPETLKPKV